MLMLWQDSVFSPWRAENNSRISNTRWLSQAHRGDGHCFNSRDSETERKGNMGWKHVHQFCIEFT